MALIRCSKCGNLASSRSAVCPICGEKIATEQTTPPTPENTQQADTPAVESTTPTVESSTPTVESTTPNARNQQKTLNDILAERQARATLNDTHAEPKQTAESVAERDAERGAERDAEREQRHDNIGVIYTPNSYAPSYDNNVRTVEEYEEEIERHKRMARGFMVGCFVLVIILIAMCVLYFIKASDYNKLEKKYKILAVQVSHVANAELSTDDVDINALRENAEELVSQLEKYKNDNDSMAMRYEEAVKMYKELESSNTHTREQLRRYQGEVETLKGIMRQYVRQIDSLHGVTTTLKTENTSMRQQIENQELRVSQAEELAEELETKVRQGEVIQVSAINITPLNDKSNNVKRMRQARRLRVDFELTANALAEPGEKSIYICITNPDGYLLASADMIVFNYEGSEMMASAMRKVDYENNMVPVSIFYDGESFAKGTYKVDIYIDGRHCGTTEKHFD